jgi:hypothetical protein
MMGCGGIRPSVTKVTTVREDWTNPTFETVDSRENRGIQQGNEQEMQTAK